MAVTIHLLEINEQICDDSKHAQSEALFQHIFLGHLDGSPLYKDSKEFISFKRLVKAHGWKIKIRQATEDDMDEG